MYNLHVPKGGRKSQQGAKDTQESTQQQQHQTQHTITPGSTIPDTHAHRSDHARFPHDHFFRSNGLPVASHGASATAPVMGFSRPRAPMGGRWCGARTPNAPPDLPGEDEPPLPAPPVDSESSTLDAAAMSSSASLPPPAPRTASGSGRLPSACAASSK